MFEPLHGGLRASPEINGRIIVLIAHPAPIRQMRSTYPEPPKGHEKSRELCTSLNEMAMCSSHVFQAMCFKRTGRPISRIQKSNWHLLCSRRG